MVFHAVIETNRITGSVTIPFCSDSYNAALNKSKELALLWWEQKTDKKGSFPWLATTLDDLVDNERTCRIEVPLEHSSICLAAGNGKIALLTPDAPAVDWIIRKVEDIDFSNSAKAEISDSYDYELIRTSVLSSLKARFPDLDESTKSVQELIDRLTCHARKNIGCGCDEDWSINEAFREMDKEICRVCETE